MPVTSGGNIGTFLASLGNGGEIRKRGERKGRLAAYEEMLAEASTYDKRASAQRGQMEVDALTGIDDKLVPVFGEELGRAIGAAARGKYNIHEGTQASGDLQKQLLERQARDALLKGDYRTANASLAAIDGKALQTTSESGGTLFNQYEDPSQRSYMTDVGRSTATENYAQAGLANTRAQDIRDGGDGEGGGSGGGKGGKGGKGFDIDGTLLNVLETPLLDSKGQPVVNPMTGQPTMGMDPTKLAEFFAFAKKRAARGGGTSLDDAVMDYTIAQHGPPPAPVFHNPGSWRPAPKGAPDGALVRDKRTGQTFRVTAGRLVPEGE